MSRVWTFCGDDMRGGCGTCHQPGLPCPNCSPELNDYMLRVLGFISPLAAATW